MKTIFANDTSGTSNPGCQGTVHGLLQTAQSRGLEIVSRLPLGYGYSLFQRLAPVTPGRSFHARVAAKIVSRASRAWRREHGHASSRETTSLVQTDVLCPDRWQAGTKTLSDRVGPIWKQADLLLINGEGTIHHDAVGARTLLAMCVVARELGLQVAIVNCSIYDLHPLLLEPLRSSVNLLSVREPLSGAWLSQQGIASDQSADSLFTALSECGSLGKLLVDVDSQGKFRLLQQRLGLPERFSLYTPGVLSGSGSIHSDYVRRDVTALRQSGVPVVYYVVEAEDERLASAAVEAGAMVLPLGSLTWRDVVPVLRQASVVISGRYHINIFSLMAGTPFVPMETNTLKTAGLLELLGCRDRVAVRTLVGSEYEPLNLQAAVCVDPHRLSGMVHLADAWQCPAAVA
jgi:hypothetical protein